MANYSGYHACDTTLTFASSGFTAKTSSFTDPAETYAKLDYTGVSDDTKSYVSGQCLDNGDLVLEIYYDPDQTVPLKETDTITIQFPRPVGTTSGAGAKLDITGFFYNYEPGTAEQGSDSLVMATVTLAVNSKTRTANTATT